MSVSHKRTVIAWEKVRAVIFDVDGTLYNQRSLRLLMLRDLIMYYFMHSSCWKDLLILHAFRRFRENMAERSQGDGEIYKIQCQLTAVKLGVSVKRVEACVANWIMSHPLQYLKSVQFPGILEFCRSLEAASIKLAAFSDYPAEEKLKVLGFPNMLTVCSVDKEVNCLKPDPKGLLFAARKLSVPVDACLLIGDRDNRDGECARRIDMPYLIKTRYSSRPNHFRCYGDLHEEFNKVRGRLEWDNISIS